MISLEVIRSCNIRSPSASITLKLSSASLSSRPTTEALAAARSNYIAGAAVDSGGWLAPVGFQNNFTPALMTIHGKPGEDVVVVDFSQTSATADAAFKDRGGYVVNCNTGANPPVLVKGT